MDRKLKPEIYRGIHYIRLAALPEEQRLLIHRWLQPQQVIKIMIDKTIISNCVQYRHYEQWYEQVYLAGESVSPGPGQREANLKVET